MNKFGIIFIIFFTSASIYAQTFYGVNSRKLNIKKEDSYLLLSIKSGYHTGYEKDKDKGFNGGLIFSANVNSSVTQETYIGLSFEIWHHTQEDYNNKINIHSRTFTGTNFSFNISKRIRGKFHSVNFGLGGGMYFINKIDGKDGDAKKGYFNMKLLAGFDFRVIDIVWISPQMEYNNMISFDRLAGTFSFQIGPTIILE